MNLQHLWCALMAVLLLVILDWGTHHWMLLAEWWFISNREWKRAAFQIRPVKIKLNLFQLIRWEVTCRAKIYFFRSASVCVSQPRPPTSLLPLSVSSTSARTSRHLHANPSECVLSSWDACLRSPATLCMCVCFICFSACREHFPPSVLNRNCCGSILPLSLPPPFCFHLHPSLLPLCMSFPGFFLSLFFSVAFPNPPLSVRLKAIKEKYRMQNNSNNPAHFHYLPTVLSLLFHSLLWQEVVKRRQKIFTETQHHWPCVLLLWYSHVSSLLLCVSILPLVCFPSFPLFSVPLCLVSPLLFPSSFPLRFLIIRLCRHFKVAR